MPGGATELGAAESPAVPAAPTREKWLRDELQRFLVALGATLEATDQRRTRDALHTLLTAQQENQAMFTQALGELRHEYSDNLGRAVDRLVERMAEELTPTSVMGLGNLFRDSANEITAAVRRSEKTQVRVLEVLGGLGEGLERLAEQVAALRTQLAHLAESRAEPELPRRASASTRSPVRSARPIPQGSPLDRLPDDM